jgi:hypothetical protein
MKVERKSMNWFSKRPLYKQMQAIRERSQARTASFEAANTAASVAFAGAQQSLFAGQASLVTQATIERTQRELQAKIKATVNLLA